MRFLADMGVSQRVVAWLRDQGHDAVHLRDEGLQRLPDRQLFSRAISEDRIILTFDLDFGEIAALAGRQAASVILFRLKNPRTPHVVERLAAVLEISAEPLTAGSLIVIEDSRHRVRTLPIR